MREFNSVWYINTQSNSNKENMDSNVIINNQTKNKKKTDFINNHRRKHNMRKSTALVLVLTIAVSICAFMPFAMAEAYYIRTDNGKTVNMGPVLDDDTKKMLQELDKLVAEANAASGTEAK